MNKLLPILIIFSNFTFSQINEDFLNAFLLEQELNQENQIEEYKKHDYSNLFSSSTNEFTYGVIGKNHQRLSVKLLNVEKDSINHSVYHVNGKSLVKNNICDFEGVILLKEIKLTKTLNFGVDDEYKDSMLVNQGVIIADYSFFENKEQAFSGVFKGELASKWYLKSDQSIHYDNISIQADSYLNNAFIGNWQSNKSGIKKVCNWGDYRVPQCNPDFDIGTGEFNVSPKYYENGWLEFAIKNQMPNGAIVQEKSRENNIKWWKIEKRE